MQPSNWSAPARAINVAVDQKQSWTVEINGLVMPEIAISTPRNLLYSQLMQRSNNLLKQVIVCHANVSFLTQKPTSLVIHNRP